MASDHRGEYFRAARGHGRRVPCGRPARWPSTGPHWGTLTRAIGRDSELNEASIAMLTRHGTYSSTRPVPCWATTRPAVDLDRGMRRVHEWLVMRGLL